MPEDFMADFDKPAAAPKASGTVDYMSDFDEKPATPKIGGLDIGRMGKAFAANILPGLVQIPEQLVNMSQYANRHLPGPALLKELTPFTSDKTQEINALNKAFGAPPQAYLDVSGQMMKNPALGFGQTPAELEKQEPLAGGIGNIVGSLPAGALIGEVGALSKLAKMAKIPPVAQKLIGGALAGGEFAAGQTGLEEAGEQAKLNDQINWMDVANKAEQQFPAGAALGLGGAALGGAMRSRQYGKVLQERQAQIQNREAAKLGNSPSYNPEQLERLEAGKSVHPVWEQYEPGQLGPEDMGTDLSSVMPHTEEVRGQVLPQESAPVVEEKVNRLIPDESWRTRREAQSRPASSEEHNLLEGLAQLAVVRDKIAAKLASAIEQIEKRLAVKGEPRKEYITPELDDIRVQFVKEHGGVPKQTKGPYIEATLSPGSTHPEAYVFEATAVRGKMKELKGLVEQWRAADKNYQNAKKGLSDKLPINDTIQVSVKDTTGKPRTINIRNRVQATGYDWPTAEIGRQYNQLKEQLIAESGDYFDRTADYLAKLLNKELKSGNQTIEYLRDANLLDWFKAIPKDTQAKAILTIGLTAAYMLAPHEEAEAKPPTNLVNKVLKEAGKSGWEAAMGSRPLTRFTQSQVTSDIIRQGNPIFGRLRDTYLAQLRRTAENPQAAEKLHTNYAKALQTEIGKLDKQNVKQGLTGQARYRRALQIDLEDMIGEPSSAREGMIESLYHKAFGGIVKSQFLGNYRAATMHILEAGVAFASKHPVASADAIRGLTTDSIYRKFASLNSPKGMFQQVLEGTESFEPKFIKDLNTQIDNAIKSVPGGEMIHGVISAQLPEQAKMGFGAVVTAVHNARKYPGGPRQYMQDWINLTEHQKAPPYARQAEFAKTEVDNFIEENKAIMSMPEGRLKERTVFQRHKMLTPLFPYLRAITQQTRFFAGLVDDLLAAVGKGDTEGATHAFKALVLGHVMVAMAAGHHVLPDYIWSILEAIDKLSTGNTENVDNLKNIIDHYQSKLAGGYRIEDFGIKYPILGLAKQPSIGLVDMGDQALRELKPKNREDVMRLGAIMLSGTILNNVGPEGTLNTAYLVERLIRGMKGTETYRKFDDNLISDLLSKVMGRPFKRKLAEEHLPFDTWQALLHWMFKIENPEEVRVNERAEKKQKKFDQKDFRTISKAWEHILAK